MVAGIQLRYLGECKTLLENFPAYHHALNSDSPLSQLEAMTHIAKLFSIVEVFSTPLERFVFRLSRDASTF